MITAETVNGIVRFQAAGLPVVSLYCRVDPDASQREVQTRVDSLLDQIRPLAKDRALDHRYRLSVRGDIERIKDALGSERWPPGTIAIFSCSGRDLYEEIPLPRRVREQARTTSCARSRTPSLVIARLTWVRTVAGLMYSFPAISSLVRPSATSAITSRSRWVIASSSAAGCGSLAGWRTQRRACGSCWGR